MKELDDLKRTWQSQSGISDERFDQLLMKVRGSSGLLQTTIFHRDMRESVAAAVVLLFFLPGLFSAKNWVSWSGFAIEVIVGFTLPLVLWHARRRRPPDASANFLEFVKVEVDFLRRQVGLLKMVTWWYLLPIYIGIVLITLGITGPRFTTFTAVFVVVYLAICTVFVVVVWRLNQVARTKNLEPLLDYYVQMQNAIERGDGFDSAPPDPPASFLEPKPRKPITKRERWIWSILILVVTCLVAVLGYWITKSFDIRTGGFVISIAPVVGLLMFFISGIWRRASPNRLTDAK